jgi:putative flippase GtrA
MNEFARFFAVTVAGVVIDIAIAFVLHDAFGTPLALAATIGFVIAASFNYVMHQTWSFRTGSRRLSFARALRYAAVAGTTLAARVGVVAALASLFGDSLALLILICGAGVSFFVNFGLSKLFVFAARPTPGSAS